jgi:hypothetical protein
VTTTEPVPPPTVDHTALRLSRTPGDMTKAVLVLLVPVAILVVVYVYFFGGNNVISIDPSQSYSDARASAQFAVLQPAGLSSRWKPVSSQFEPGATSTLRVGYVAPDGGGIQLIETDKPANAVISSELGSVGPVAKSVQAGGITWGVVNGKDSDLGLVDTESGRTVIISGQASEPELQQFAASLR